MSSLENNLPEQPVSAALASAIEVRKRFGKTQALDGVSLSINAGAVHVLIGRNGSGKSTLVSLFTGLQVPDSGRIEFAGSPAPPPGRRGDWRRLVACVYQHSLLVPQLSVAENLFMGEPQAGLRFSKAKIEVAAARLLSEWELDIDERATVSTLEAHERQLIEIVRATRDGTRLLILDEPTTRLARTEVEHLFAAVRRIRDRGGAVLFISHYLQEAFEIGDQLTVLRDGRVVAEMDPKSSTEDDVVKEMVGIAVARVTAMRNGRDVGADAEPLVEVSGLRIGPVDGIDLEIRRGECLGLAGTNDSGNRLVASCLAGLASPSAGTVTVGGKTLRLGSVPEAIGSGVAMVPADRGYNGVVPKLSIEENITMAAWSQASRFGVIRPSARKRMAADLIAQMGVVGAGAEQEVSSLSGGNQQKVVVGRALATKPRFLILVEPTSGVDIASRETIFRTIREALNSGITVLVVSERPEECVLCTRVLVMFRGRVTRELGPDRTEHELVAAMEGVEFSVHD